MEDTGDAPPARPTDTAERPAQPKAQPIPDEADLPKGGLEVKPQTQPPSGNQPTQSPKNTDPRLVPPTIIGGTALAKLAYDKMRDKTYQLTSEDTKQLQDVANHRSQNGMPTVSADRTSGTVSSLIIDGKTVSYGHSTVIERESKLGTDNRQAREALLKELQNDGLLPNKPYGKPDVQVVTHAEIESLIEAKKSLGSLEGKDITIYVDREPCPDCFRLIPQLAAKWKTGDITIISDNPKTGAGKVTIFKLSQEGVK
jgi:tRNA(Arg) A34 adenosine deaminase TadA